MFLPAWRPLCALLRLFRLPTVFLSRKFTWKGFATSWIPQAAQPRTSRYHRYISNLQHLFCFDFFGKILAPHPPETKVKHCFGRHLCCPRGVGLRETKSITSRCSTDSSRAPPPSPWWVVSTYALVVGALSGDRQQPQIVVPHHFRRCALERMVFYHWRYFSPGCEYFPPTVRPSRRRTSRQHRH